jgi:hypothetical protein
VFYVDARYHRDPSRVGGQIRYISHREEDLADGRRRELYGIGARYRALRGDEQAIRDAFRNDARGLRSPVYFRFILTVDDAAAERVMRLGWHLSERVVRDAIDRSFRDSVRGAQGVFSIHQHGGEKRAAHPHIHALLSPRFQNGMPVHISPERIQRVKARWEREVLSGLERQERRFFRYRELPAPEDRPRDEDARKPPPTLVPSRRHLVRDRQLDVLGTARRRVRLLRGNAWTRRLLPFARHAARWERNPEQVARRAVFHLATRALPARIRDVIWLLRGLRGRDFRPR